MPPTVALRSAGRSCRALEQPLPDRRRKVRRLIRIEARDVDLRDQSIQWAAALARRGFQGTPEHRLQTDRRLMPGDQHRAFPGRRVGRHQYMFWPPLIDSVE